ncbi:MAG: hypothetical protein KDD11_15195, partial [Acidobacteria bacterium]|nr:hypothetical protein [Acidobacteriota bacterium]
VSCSAAACSGPAQELIERLVLTAGGSIQIDVADRLTAEQIGTLNCTLYADHHMILPAEHLSFQEIFAALSTAMVTNQEISLRIVDGSPDCEIRYISLYSPTTAG